MMSQQEKKKIRSLVNAAILAGDMVPLPCSVCGEKAEAHHPSYDRPEEIEWLCKKHHSIKHAEMNAGTIPDGFPRKLFDAMTHLGINKSELSCLSGVSVPSLYSILSGRRKARFSTAAMLADAVGANTESLGYVRRTCNPGRRMFFIETPSCAKDLFVIMRDDEFKDCTKSEIIRLAIRELARRVTRKAKA